MYIRRKLLMRAHANADYKDKNINSLIIQHAHRIVNYYRAVDNELMHMFSKCDIKFARSLVNHVKTLLTPNRYKQLKREIKEEQVSELEPDGEIVVDACIKYITKRNKRKVVTFVTDHFGTKKHTPLNKFLKANPYNLTMFSSMFNLSTDEVALVTFLFILKNWKNAEEYFEDHLEITKPLNRMALSVALDMPSDRLRAAITGRLSKLGIVKEDDYKDLRLSNTFNQFLFDLNENAILEDFYWKKLNTNSIDLNKHLVSAEVTGHLVQIINRHDNSSSTNILIYGHPGTGKTSYAKSLIRELGLEAYEIVNSNDNSVDTRRAALVACLNMIGGRNNSIVLADDADNILNTQDSFSFRGEVSDKSWLNSLMDDPNTKIIWIVNDVSMIEESVKRRFAYSYHFKKFNTQQRQTIWLSVLKQHGVKTMLNTQTVHELAQKYKVSTGVIDISVLKAKEAAGEAKNTFLQALTLNLDSHVQLQANGRRSKRPQVTSEYSLAGLNMSGNVETILGQVRACSDRLRKNDTSNSPVIGSNLLIHGVPGGGKSEFAKFLAHTLERELIIKRASDLLGMYVGESEKQVAEAFYTAEDREAVLVIDEVDSFLSSRALASRNHEVTLVNEFLTQMEQFKGVLVCTTNNLKMLDPACIRRFVHKIEFKYLTSNGCLSFYNKILGQLSPMPLTTEEMTIVSKIANLTPGDFRVVRDQYYYSENVTNGTMINALILEAKTKTVLMGCKPIGFNK